MADRENTPRISRKPSAIAHGADHRILDAHCLSLAQQLVVLDESTELPPFGMCMSALQRRLKHRLGLDIAEVCHPFLGIHVSFSHPFFRGVDETHKVTALLKTTIFEGTVKMDGRTGVCLPTGAVSPPNLVGFAQAIRRCPMSSKALERQWFRCV